MVPNNPNLEHLTGMAGISPIAPGADGPMIMIQPSTPISGLKESRGVFDAALRRASAQAAGASQNGQHVAWAASNGQQAGQQYQTDQQPQLNDTFAGWSQADLLRTGGQMRPRAKSDSFTTTPTDAVKQQVLMQLMAAQAQAQGNADINMGQVMQGGMTDDQRRASIDSWRTSMGNPGSQNQSTVDPNMIPGREYSDPLMNQYAQLQAQQRISPINIDAGNTPQTGNAMSPITWAIYQQLNSNSLVGSGGTESAPFWTSSFGSFASAGDVNNGQASRDQLSAQPDLHARRRSFAEGSNHPAAGLGTPGYGVEFSSIGTLRPGAARGASPSGHRRGVKSEDYGRGTGWGVGAGGST